MSQVHLNQLNAASLHSQLSTGSELLDTFGHTAPEPYQSTALFDYANSEKLGLQGMDVNTWTEPSLKEIARAKPQTPSSPAERHSESKANTSHKTATSQNVSDPAMGTKSARAKAVERLTRTLKDDRTTCQS
ncbi:MAG: hypothetical protein AAGM27_05060 [Cyanobacteria bacterium J06554_3]